MFELTVEQIEKLEEKFDTIQDKSELFRLGHILDRVGDGRQINKYDMEFLQPFLK